jgi:metal-dependent amidase/aminoacylase/carboxypeptidase family protein
MTTNLNEKAMLVKLSISQWSARKQDKRATKTVQDTFGTSDDAGRYSKALVAQEAIKAVQKTANAARTAHYENTLPWNDDGARILPAANFQEYSALMREHRQNFEDAVRELVSNYPALVSQARIDLNGLFNPDEYPDENKIRSKYSFDVTVDPMPAAQDFRVDLHDDDVARIQADIEARTRTAQERAMADLWERLHKTVAHMAEKLSEPDAIFRDSLINNVCDLCQLLPRLNITNDPNLEALRREIEEKLCNYDPEELRRSQPNSMMNTSRRDAANDAQAIIDKMSAYMGV